MYALVRRHGPGRFRVTESNVKGTQAQSHVTDMHPVVLAGRRYPSAHWDQVRPADGVWLYVNKEQAMLAQVTMEEMAETALRAAACPLVVAVFKEASDRMDAPMLRAAFVALRERGHEFLEGDCPRCEHLPVVK